MKYRELAKRLQAQLSQANLETESAKKEAQIAKKQWLDEVQKNSQGMHAKFELLKLQKQLRVIQFIAAGESDKAILEILDPSQVMFNIEVVYGDDKTRVKAQEELLQQVVGKVKDTLDSLRVKEDSTGRFNRDRQSPERGEAVRTLTV